MQITVNRDYARRHLGVAILFTALTCWFLYDGAIAYPQKDETYFEETLHTKKERAIDRQFQFAGLAFLFACVVAGGVWRVTRETLSWDEKFMIGTLTGKRPLAFDDVAALDTRRWKKKGILVAMARDGRRVTLDAWHHAGVKELAVRLGVEKD